MLINSSLVPVQLFNIWPNNFENYISTAYRAPKLCFLGLGSTISELFAQPFNDCLPNISKRVYTIFLVSSSTVPVPNNLKRVKTNVGRFLPQVLKYWFDSWKEHCPNCCISCSFDNYNIGISLSIYNYYVHILKHQKTETWIFTHF